MVITVSYNLVIYVNLNQENENPAQDTLFHPSIFFC